MHQVSRIFLSALGTLFLVAGAQAQYVEATITVGNAPSAIVYDSIDRRVFVANNGSNSVSVINPESNTVSATVTITNPPVAAVWNPTNNRVYVACAPMASPGTVAVIDAAYAQLLDEIGVGTEPVALAWHPGYNKLYCLNRADNSLTVIDCSNNQVITQIDLIDQIPNELTYNPANGFIYVANGAYHQNSKVRVIDCSADTILTTVTVQQSAWSFAVNLTSNRVFIANRLSNSVSVVNGATNTLIATIATQQEPKPLLWIPTNKLFVGEYWNNSVAFMHGDSTRLPSRLSITSSPNTMLYAPLTERVYCTNYLGGLVSLIDARDGQERVIAELPTGGGPNAMSYYPDQRRVYIANFWENTVTVIKDVTGIAEEPRLTPNSTLLGLRALPNPVPSGNLVSFQVTGFEPDRLIVRDIGGRVVYAGAPQAWRVRSPGIYFCSMAGATGAQATCKVVAQ